MKVQAPRQAVLSIAFRPQNLHQKQHKHCSSSLKQQTRHQKLSSSLRVSAGDVRKVNSEELQQALNERQKPIVLDFYATWCGPCLLLAKELEKVSEELGDKIQILKIDTDENPDLSNQLRIEGLPTMVFVGSDFSKPAIRTEGLLPAETIIKIINEELLTMYDSILYLRGERETLEINCARYLEAMPLSEGIRSSVQKPSEMEMPPQISDLIRCVNHQAAQNS